MGLDMNLYKKTYVKNWDYMPKNKLHKITVKRGGQLVKTINPNKVVYVVEEVAYWRKANAIHKWFVDNVQEGNDDCKTYYVSRTDLLNLLDVVNQVLKASKLVKGKVHNGTRWTKEGGTEEIIKNGMVIENPEVAKELLPTGEGFFFGSCDYDEWYYKDLKYTQEVLTEALKDELADFEYNSSW